MKPLRLIGLFLVFGLVANVIVAWACAICLPVHDSGERGPMVPVETEGSPAETHSYEMRRAGARRVVSWPHDDANASPTVDDRRGWPMTSLFCRIRTKSDAVDCYAIQVIGGIGMVNVRQKEAIGDASASATYAAADTPDFYSTIALPCLPVWPGFVVNTVLFASVLLALLQGPAAVRRAARSLAGRCIQCGYELHGDADAGCPECGWNRPATHRNK